MTLSFPTRRSSDLYTLERRWRGVSDHHAIDAAFLASQEARRLHKLAAEQAEAYASPARLVKATAAAVAEVEIAEDGDEGETPVTSGAKASPGQRPSELLDAIRSEERRVGDECVSTVRFRRSPKHSKIKEKKKTVIS